MTKRPDVNTALAGHRSAASLDETLTAIVEAFDNTLSRDGSTPNSMDADLDLNSKNILNADKLYANRLFVSGAQITDAVYVPTWRGAWVTTTSYAINDLVREDGTTYICTTAHTSGTFSTDLTAGYWEILASKGSSGAGTGDLLAANNLSDLADPATARSNLGFGSVATENTVPITKGGTGATTASAARSSLGLGGLATLDILDEDDMVSNSATRPPSQQSVIAYVGSQSGWELIAASSTIVSGAIVVTGLGSYSEIKVIGDSLTATNDNYRSLQVSSNGGSSWISTGYLRNGTSGSTSTAIGHNNSGTTAKNPSWCITGFNKTWAVKPMDTPFDGDTAVIGIKDSNAFNAIKVYQLKASEFESALITGGTVYVFGKV